MLFQKKANAAAQKDEQKNPPTRPWEKKHDANKSWRVDYVRLAKKRPGFRPHWFRKDRVALKQMQGWSVARPKDYEIDPINVLDGQSVGDFIQRAELILMEMPEEMAQARADAMEERTKAAQRAAKAETTRELADVNKQLADMGAAPATLVDETEGIR